MKLNTKKGGIELHADETRALKKAQGVISDIQRHGNSKQSAAADKALAAIVEVWHSLATSGEEA